ncbi:MAG TPA: hypothetical protein VN736_28330 [Candidatus Limnocylindrales bacterium]|nr:hypothetical protein [Candidatus Limnocylindrales bacterium]
MMGVTLNRRLPKALAGLSALALMAVAAMTTLNAQTTTTLLAPRLAVRALTPGELTNYKLPSTTQLSGGLNTVALGEPLYLEVQIDANIPAAQIAGVVWSLDTKPNLSNATLAPSPLTSAVPVAEPSDRLVYQVAGRQMLKPDVHGMYVITAIVTAGSSGSTKISQTYIAGTYVGETACARCHSGGLAQSMAPAWSKTVHTQLFTQGINGDQGAHYTGSCVSCHVLGYDANNSIPNGGYTDIAKQLNFTFPTPAPGNFDKLDPKLQNLGSIQCENCHGPGSEHANFGGSTMAISKPSNTGACQQCHDAPTHHGKGTAWMSSAHAITTRDTAGNATCAGCHSGNAFAVKAAGNKITDASYSVIDCATCHEPHGITPDGSAHQIRKMDSATLANGVKVTGTGSGTLCMNCHMSRQNATVYADTTAGSAHFGPHEGPQADMLMGTNGYTYGKKIPTSAHQFVVADTCVTCHMQTVATTDPAFLQAGDHTFRTTYAPAGKAAENLTAACQGCHGKQVDSFNFQLFDYNGDGQIDGVQTEVQSLLDQLSTLLPPNNKVKSDLTIDNTWTKQQLEAAYNWLFVMHDGSKGVHNTAYAVGLLKASIANLQGK